MLNNLLVYRFVVFNLVMLVMLMASVVMGLGYDAFTLDISYITWIIAALFTITLGSTGVQGWKIAGTINRYKVGQIFLGKNAAQKRLEKIEHIQSCANWMVTLGLLGTVYGFLIALSGVSVEQASNITGVQKLVTHLIAGAQTALYTTLVGGFFGLWTEVNYRMVKTAAVVLEKDAL